MSRQEPAFTLNISDVERILGKEAVLRLQSVQVGQTLINRCLTISDAQQPINVLRNLDERDPFIGAEIVGHIVLHNPREYDDTPEAAIYQALRLVTQFDIKSKMPIPLSVSKL